MTPVDTANATRISGFLRFGSLGVVVDAPRRVYLEDLEAIYCTPLTDRASPALVNIEIVEAFGSLPVKVPPDGMVITPEGALHTEAMFAQTALGGDEPRVRLTVFAAALPENERRVYLFVLLNKILFWLGYLRLHASAVALDGRASVFIGDRGAGKSSICAYLAGRGAVVLADDDVMLNYSGDGCVVSGCDESMRIMGDAEQHLFGHLDVPAVSFGGFLKKEIVTADRFAVAPYVDHELSCMFFPRVGERFAMRRLQSSRVVMRLMKTLVPSNRFAGSRDHAQTLNYLADVAARVPAYDLTLSRDFDGLERLFEFLASAD